MMPGMGWPVVTSSTMCANDEGYGTAGSLIFEEVGRMPPAASVLVDVVEVGTPFAGPALAARAE